jgi:hypothetical protein
MSKKSKKSTKEKPVEDVEVVIEKPPIKQKTRLPKQERAAELKETNPAWSSEKKKKKKQSSKEKEDKQDIRRKSEKKKRKLSALDTQSEPAAIDTVESHSPTEAAVLKIRKKSKKSKSESKPEKPSNDDLNFSGGQTTLDLGRNPKSNNSVRERTASASMTFQQAQNHEVESRQARKRQLSYEKVYKSVEEQYQLDEVKEVLPFVKVSNVNLDQDTRVTTQKWRPSKNDIAPEKESFNSGMFSQTERESIERAIESYLEEHGLSKPDLPYLIQPKLKKMDTNPYPQHRGFSAKIRDMSKVNRTIPQVYWYLRKKYSEYRIQDEVPSKWTPEDDKRLLHYINVIGAGKWTEIEQALGRDGAKVSLFHVGSI